MNPVEKPPFFTYQSGTTMMLIIQPDSISISDVPIEYTMVQDGATVLWKHRHLYSNSGETRTCFPHNADELDMKRASSADLVLTRANVGL